MSQPSTEDALAPYKKVHRALLTSTASKWRDLDLSMQQLRAMYFLRDEEGMSVGRLAELFGKLLADDAGYNVGAAAGSGGHDDGDRPGGKILRRERCRGRAEAQQRRCECTSMKSVEHGCPASFGFYAVTQLRFCAAGSLSSIPLARRHTAR